MKKYLFLHESVLEDQKKIGDFPVREDHIYYGTEAELADMTDNPLEWFKIVKMTRFDDGTGLCYKCGYFGCSSYCEG
jgi:hypothetical protein